MVCISTWGVPMHGIHQKSNNTIQLLQGEPGAAGLGGLHGLPGEDGAPGQKVHYANSVENFYYLSQFPSSI